MKRFIEWIKKYQAFLNEVRIDEHGNKRPTHERILKVERSLFKLIKENTLFTYLDEELVQDISPPLDRVGINSRLREMLRNHRGFY